MIFITTETPLCRIEDKFLRFAINLLVLDSVLRSRPALKAMVLSDEWESHATDNPNPNGKGAFTDVGQG
ncbi:hypothetical protein GPECTOR_744g906 [Gonium pectorale]|uniref:Uncharacterized protein n=1 Tax=Gonium pectorale TaxID=33097 RepID=A0A150FU48_GONPE|nr:hypothetical protein GPECTOR_744g906 [Gonium pectorale]|eukprot:KXZ41132.1 hypothetical protein GPECTOR_744g906 [Gonium pectorale]